MSGQIDWAELFFSSTGRVARTPFLVAASLLTALAMVYEAAMGPNLHWLTGWVVYPGLLFSAACVLSKPGRLPRLRLRHRHRLGRRGAGRHVRRTGRQPLWTQPGEAGSGLKVPS